MKKKKGINIKLIFGVVLFMALTPILVMYAKDASLSFDNRSKASSDVKIKVLLTKYNNKIIDSRTTFTDGRLGRGAKGTGDYIGVKSPTVIKDGSEYKMWYVGVGGGGERIFYATSKDGLIWKKQDNSIPSASDTTGTNGRIPLGTEGKGDSEGVDSPMVIKDGGMYKMWYTGTYKKVSYIFYATSPDGLTWTKYDNSIPTNSDSDGTMGRIPLGSAGKGDSTGTSSPAVIKDGSVYKMWYVGDAGRSKLNIYYATSPDGINWKKYDNSIPERSNVRGTNGRLPIGLPISGDYIRLNHPTVIKDGDLYRMWYSGVGSETGKNLRIMVYYATSPDGLTWTKYNNTRPRRSNNHDRESRLPIGEINDERLRVGDSARVFGATAIKDDRLYKVWYTGVGSILKKDEESGNKEYMSFDAIYYATGIVNENPTQ